MRDLANADPLSNFLGSLKDVRFRWLWIFGLFWCDPSYLSDILPQSIDTLDQYALSIIVISTYISLGEHPVVY